MHACTNMATWYYYSYITALEKRKSMGDAGGIWRERRKKERKREVPTGPHMLLSRTTQQANTLMQCPVRISTNLCRLQCAS